MSDSCIQYQYLNLTKHTHHCLLLLYNSFLHIICRIKAMFIKKTKQSPLSNEESRCLLSASGCHMVSSLEESPGGSRSRPPPVIFNPDFFVEKLRHESPDVFLELVMSNISRLIDLPGAEFSQLLGDDGPKTPTGGGFFRSFNFLKRKGVCACCHQ